MYSATGGILKSCVLLISKLTHPILLYSYRKIISKMID
ncbi:hypothetical protein FH5_01667 [Priestia endophytica]|nr:hypothetical protein FH5_01667 [Priestia endophytica]